MKRTKEQKKVAKYLVITAFGAKLVSPHLKQADAHNAAVAHSYTEPVDIWTTKGGAFGMGKVVAHYNSGERTIQRKGRYTK